MNQKIDEIIAAKINGTATDVQNEILEEWMESDPLNKEAFHHMDTFLAAKHTDSEIINQEEIRDQIWKKSGKVGENKTRVLLFSRFSKVAAVILILMASYFVLFSLMNGQLAESEKSQISIVEKSNLSGVKSTIHLPDGSKIILNSSSRISYAEKFSDSVRWVKLEGEAYFEVAKNPNKPFIVQSGNVLTQAIGTSFNIKSNLSQNDVSLVEGVVMVRQINSSTHSEDILLNPGEYVSYSGNKIPKKGSFDIMDVTGWKEGLLIFRSDPFEIVKERLENWYGVQISFSGEVPTWSLNATYDNDNLENILKTLSHSQGLKYEITGNNVKIIL